MDVCDSFCFMRALLPFDSNGDASVVDSASALDVGHCTFRTPNRTCFGCDWHRTEPLGDFWENER